MSRRRWSDVPKLLQTTGRVWSVAKPLYGTPADKRNPDGVTEQTLMFLSPRRGCRYRKRNKQGLHPCLCSRQPFGLFLLHSQ